MFLRNEQGLCKRALNSSTFTPKLQHWTLNNGAQCIMAPMDEAPLTCIDLWCKAGSAFEDKGEEGIAHFLEHMVFKGSKVLNAGEFDLKIEALGGSSNAATGFDDVHFYVLVPHSETLTAIELLLDLVLNPALTKDSFLIEREVVLEEIAQFKDQPDEIVFQELLTNCWKKHSYGRPILGFASTLKEMSEQQMKRFHERCYIGENCCISIAGTIPNNIKEFLSHSSLSKLKRTDYLKDQSTKKESPLFNQGRKEISVSRLESARFLMAWPMPPASQQETIMGIDIATSILSEGRRSRLVQHLRESLQIVESIEMDITVLERGSIVVLEAYCNSADLNKVEEEVNTLLRQSSSIPLTSKEVDRAKKLVSNGLTFSIETSSQVAGLAGNQALWDRNQPLLNPLNYVIEWSPNRLKKEILSKLIPESSFTLIAKPKEENI